MFQHALSALSWVSVNLIAAIHNTEELAMNNIPLNSNVTTQIGVHYYSK